LGFWLCLFLFFFFFFFFKHSDKKIIKSAKITSYFSVFSDPSQLQKYPASLFTYLLKLFPENALPSVRHSKDCVFLLWDLFYAVSRFCGDEPAPIDLLCNTAEKLYKFILILAKGRILDFRITIDCVVYQFFF